MVVLNYLTKITKRLTFVIMNNFLHSIEDEPPPFPFLDVASHLSEVAPARQKKSVKTIN